MAESDEYARFVEAMESRPVGMSPLMRLATMKDKPANATALMLCWLRTAPREETEQK